VNLKIILSVLLLSGCDSVFIEPAQWDADDYGGGIVEKIHYETTLKYSANVGSCFPHCNELKEKFAEVGMESERLAVIPFRGGVPHCVLLMNGLVYGNGSLQALYRDGDTKPGSRFQPSAGNWGYMQASNYVEAYPVEELSRFGEYESCESGNIICVGGEI